MSRLARYQWGPREGGVSVVNLGAATQGIIDLSQFADDPSGIELGISSSAATPLFFKFTSDPAAVCSGTATAGVQRTFASSQLEPFVVPNGARYLAFTCASASLVRVAGLHGKGPLTPANLQMMNIVIEGDSNAALDAPAAGFAGQRGQWPYKLQDELVKLGVPAKLIAVLAASGRQWNDPSGLAPVSAVANGPTFDATTRTALFNVGIVSIGTNDVNSLGHNLAQLQTNFNLWCDNRIAAGVYDALVFVQPPPQTLNPAKDAILNSYWAYVLTQVGTRIQAACALPSTLQASVVNGVRNPLFVANANSNVAEHYNNLGAIELASAIATTLCRLTIPAP
jgi:hypothetical protein